ncbi:MAG: HisA/HisF-related TIM barrel protein [Erythrobacter sp.]
MELRTRVIPCLQVRAGSLIKTTRFDKFGYIGDPANTCRIFNECEVDELAMLDVRATVSAQGPDFRLLHEIADECFMPVAYGGGLTTLDQVEQVLRIGIEKVIIGSAAYADPAFLKSIAREFGSQCLVSAIDVARDRRSGLHCKARSGTVSTGHRPVEWARKVEELGAGEVLLTSIDREGTWLGLDHELIAEVSKNVSVPVIAHGGANSKDDVVKAVRSSGASAVALGNMVVYQKRGMGVLVNFPSIDFTK